MGNRLSHYLETLGETMLHFLDCPIFLVVIFFERSEGTLLGWSDKYFRYHLSGFTCKLNPNVNHSFVTLIIVEKKDQR